MSWVSLRGEREKPLRRRLSLYRRVLLDKDRLLSSRLGLYSAATTTSEYFNGLLDAPHDVVFDALLESSKLDPSFISFLKYRPELEESGPAASSWVYRRHLFSTLQYHVVLFANEQEEVGECVYVFSHHEYNWIRHPIKHFRREHVKPDTDSSTLKALLEDVPVTFVEPDDIFNSPSDYSVLEALNKGERP